MAAFHPDPLPEYIRQDPFRSAEVQVYEAMQGQLGPDFSVYYSRPWIGTAPDGREIDGEADFVVAHPVRGVLVIEVKGGAVSQDGRTGRWTSKDRFGVTHNIKNPVAQARSSKYQIIQKLKQAPHGPTGMIPACCGVILPHCARPSEDLGVDMPLSIFAFTEDMNFLAEWVERRFDDSAGTDPGRWTELGERGIQTLDRLLARSFELRIPLRADLDLQDARIIRLTEQQYHLLEFLGDTPRTAIHGGAGSGKTLLAMECARRNAMSGRRTALVCYNRPLAIRLGRDLEGTGVVTGTFHSLTHSLARSAGIDAGLAGNPDELADMLLEAVDRRPELRFGAIVIDEAQDFRESWISSLSLALDGSDPRLHVFYDGNQSLYAGRAVFGGFEHATFPLSRNLRNAKPIFDLARPLWSGGPYVGAGPEGAQVEFVEADPEDQPNRVLQALGHLVSNERIDIGQICVLCQDGDMIDRLREALRGRYETCLADEVEPTGVVIDTIRRFKGLESRVVVLVATRELIDEPELAYVALTRARLLLVQIGDSTTVSWFRKPAASA